MPLKRALARTMASAFDDELRVTLPWIPEPSTVNNKLKCRALESRVGLRQNHTKIIGKTKKSAFCVPYSVTLAK
jgi:hypothetical protein